MRLSESASDVLLGIGPRPYGLPKDASEPAPDQAATPFAGVLADIVAGAEANPTSLAAATGTDGAEGKVSVDLAEGGTTMKITPPRYMEPRGGATASRADEPKPGRTTSVKALIGNLFATAAAETAGKARVQAGAEREISPTSDDEVRRPRAVASSNELMAMLLTGSRTPSSVSVPSAVDEPPVRHADAPAAVTVDTGAPAAATRRTPADTPLLGGDAGRDLATEPRRINAAPFVPEGPDAGTPARPNAANNETRAIVSEQKVATHLAPSAPASQRFTARRLETPVIAEVPEASIEGRGPGQEQVPATTNETGFVAPSANGPARTPAAKTIARQTVMAPVAVAEMTSGEAVILQTAVAKGATPAATSSPVRAVDESKTSTQSKASTLSETSTFSKTSTLTMPRGEAPPLAPTSRIVSGDLADRAAPTDVDPPVARRADETVEPRADAAARTDTGVMVDGPRDRPNVAVSRIVAAVTEAEAKTTLLASPSIAPARTLTLRLDQADSGAVGIRMHLVGRDLGLEITVSDRQTLAELNRDRHTLAAALGDRQYQVTSLVILDGSGAPPAPGNHQGAPSGGSENGARPETPGSGDRGRGERHGHHQGDRPPRDGGTPDAGTPRRASGARRGSLFV